ncbi:hypothetical protein D3C72_2163210 [compost metagenome]
MAPVRIQILAGWRVRIIMKSSVRDSTSLTGLRVRKAISAATGCTVVSVLPPNAPPTRVRITRTFDIGTPRISAVVACTRCTAWQGDQITILPASSTSATAPHGSM